MKNLLQPAPFHYREKDWKPLDSELILKSTDPRQLGYGGRQWQIRCYNVFHHKRLTILIAPTGSGKSLMLVFNAAREVLESDYKQKQLFLVPQLNIGNGFTENRNAKLVIDGQVYDWEITENCCDNNVQSVKRIKKFLLTNNSCKPYRANKVIGGCTASATYAAFLAAWKTMSRKQKLVAIKNTSFRIDETHHISNVTEGGVKANRLGKFCKFLLDNNGSLHLATGTFFRGDRQTILGNHYLEEFEIFRVPFLEHWETLGLKELEQSFCPYKDSDDLMNQILSSIASEPEPSLIIVPNDGTKIFKNTNKWKWVTELIDGLSHIYGDNEIILDLVTPEKKKEGKKLLESEAQDFYVVVTCQIGREGTDWPPCSRIYNVALDGNTQQVLQKLGRGLRPHEGKTDIKMFNYIKHFDNWDDNPETIREHLSDRFNAVMLSSMSDDMFYPILMPSIPSEDENGNEKKSIQVSLEDVYGNKRNEIIEQMMRSVLEIPDDGRTVEIIDEIIDALIKTYDEDMLENVSYEVLKDRLRKELLRRQNPTDEDLRLNILADFIRKEGGWDKVFRKYIAHNSPFVGKATTKELKQLSKFLNGDWLEIFEKIEKIGLKNLKVGTSEYRWAKYYIARM